MEEQNQDTKPQAEADEPKIMCYVSKRMVPKSKTLEVEYAPGKKVWVLAKYIRFQTEAAAS